MGEREQRAFFRVTFGDVPVTGTVISTGAIPVPGPTFQGLVLNVSGGGILLQVDKDLPAREHLVVRLEFTLEDEPISVEAHILRKTDILTTYEYGCEFVSLPERIRANLVRILNRVELARRKPTNEPARGKR